MVEFAILVPVFALLLFAMIDFGMAFQSFTGLRNGVNAGAREASVNAIDSSCSSAGAYAMVCTVDDRIGKLLGVDPNSLQINLIFPTGSSAVGQPVEVCAHVNLQATTGITAPFISGKVIHTYSELRLEQAPTYSQGSMTISGGVPTYSSSASC